MSSNTSPSAAEGVFRGPDRAEKGSALTMIAAETQAVNDKTTRLRALRMERDAKAEAVADDEAASAAPVKKAPARKRTVKAKA